MSLTKLSLAGSLALLAGIAVMTTLHRFAWQWFGMGPTDAVAMHPGAGMPHDMPWLMALGPLAMVLAFTGLVLLIVSLVRLATRNA